MSRIIGIDFGTTNSVIAVMDSGSPIIIPAADGTRLTPSIVGINPKTNERLVGQLARQQAVINPENTIYSVKRFLGRRFDHPEVARARALVPYQMSQSPKGGVLIHLGGKTYTPEEITAMILMKLKADAEKHLGLMVDSAVITAPAYFDDLQRSAIKDAGRIAGLDIRRIINEPTAAALGYGLDNTQRTVAICDLGGSKFDVSLLTMGDGVFEVRSTNGDAYLGGDNFDEALINDLADKFLRTHQIDLRKDRHALQRLKLAAENAKIALSGKVSTDIQLPFISADAAGAKHLTAELNRAQFEKLTAELIDRLQKPCEMALKDAGISAKAIDQVLLVGGMTQMPAVAQAFEKIFGQTPRRSGKADEVCALGAAIQAGILEGYVKDVLLLDVTPLTISIETLGGVATPMIQRNTTIPTRKSQIFSTAADNQTQVELHIVQGERPMAADNKSLGRFILDGIPPAPRGVPQIEAIFDIDANGILQVSARDKATGREQKISITSSTGLSEPEIKRMVEEAARNAAEDQRRQQLAEAANSADGSRLAAEKVLREYGERLPDDAKAQTQTLLDALVEAQKGENATAIRAAVDALNAHVMTLGEKLYTQAEAAPPTTDAPTPSAASAALKLFISYSSRNRDLATALANAFEGLGHEVWIDQELTGGQQWWDEILKAIRTCDLFVYAVTEDALDSYPCRLERNYAHDLRKRMLPVQLTDVNLQLLSVRDASIQFVNFRSTNSARLEDLRRALEHLPPASAPPNPLPKEPPVPISPISRLRDLLDKSELERDEQLQVLLELELLVEKSATREGALRLLRLMRDRDDLLAAADRKIQRLLDAYDT